MGDQIVLNVKNLGNAENLSFLKHMQYMSGHVANQ